MAAEPGVSVTTNTLFGGKRNWLVLKSHHKSSMYDYKYTMYEISFCSKIKSESFNFNSRKKV